MVSRGERSATRGIANNLMKRELARTNGCMCSSDLPELELLMVKRQWLRGSGLIVYKENITINENDIKHRRRKLALLLISS